jgi:hypothetical protein
MYQLLSWLQTSGQELMRCGKRADVELLTDERGRDHDRVSDNGEEREMTPHGSS